MEKSAVWAYENMATWECLTLFVIIGVFSLWGAVTNDSSLTLTFGALSSYFIQLVSLAIIAIGQKVESERNSHVLAEILFHVEKILPQETWPA